MRKLFVLVLLAGYFLQAGATTDLTNGLVAHYPLNGKAVDATGKNKNGKIINSRSTAGRNGKTTGAMAFKTQNSGKIILPVDASPKTLPVITITAWLRPHLSRGGNPVITCGNDKKDRCLFMDDYDHIYHWVMQCGKDGVLKGPVVLANQWTFVSLMYDAKNQEGRFIVNEALYSGRAAVGWDHSGITLGQFDGDIAEVRVYNRFLTLPELEELYGKKINATAEALVVTERYDYKEKRKREEQESVKAGDVYIVGVDEFIVKDSVKNGNNKAVLTNGDTLRVDSVIDRYLLVIYKDGQKGFVSRGTLTENAYPEGSSALALTAKTTFKNIFNFTRLTSWIIVVIFAIILFFAKKYFIRIDELLNRLRRKDIYATGGSKSGAMVEKITFLHRIFPPRAVRWWPLLPGLIAGFSLFFALLMNGSETEWFFNEGMNLIPAGYDRWIHWFLFGVLWMLVLGFVAICLESYVVAGPVIMWLRIFIILLLNTMAFITAFYLAVVLAIIVVVMIGLFILSAAGSGGNKRCLRCGTVFSGNSCPKCG